MNVRFCIFVLVSACLLIVLTWRRSDIENVEVWVGRMEICDQDHYQDKDVGMSSKMSHKKMDQISELSLLADNRYLPVLKDGDHEIVIDVVVVLCP